MNSSGMPNFSTAVEVAERPQGEWKGYNADKGGDWLRDDGTPVFLVCDKCYGTVINNGSAHWNYCPNCGAKMKGADDYERAIEQMEHDMLYEPTYNSEDGSM